MTRYRSEPPDIVEQVLDLKTRIDKLDNNPRAIATSIDTGDLVLKNGRLYVANSSGGYVIQIYIDPLFLSTPVTYLLPRGSTTDHLGAIRGFDTGPDTFLQFVVVSTAHTVDGSEFSIFGNGFVLDYIHAGFSGDRAYIQGTPNGSPGDIGLFWHGQWRQTMFTNEDCLYPGNVSVSAGFGSVSVSYPITFSTTVVPYVGLTDTAGLVDWCLTAFSTSGFTVAWTGTLAKEVAFWCVRTV